MVQADARLGWAEPDRPGGSCRRVELSAAEFAAIRHLLEEESTWSEVDGYGRGSRRSDRVSLTGRPAGSALAAGRAIAAGLLEFAVYDLEPELFGQVLFARLDRFQTGQASALDQAMLGCTLTWPRSSPRMMRPTLPVCSGD